MHDISVSAIAAAIAFCLGIIFISITGVGQSREKFFVKLTSLLFGCLIGWILDYFFM